MTDIKSPPYYTWHPMIECREVSQWYPSNVGQAIQYLWRLGRKGDDDFDKSMIFLIFEVERLRKYLPGARVADWYPRPMVWRQWDSDDFLAPFDPRAQSPLYSLLYSQQHRKQLCVIEDAVGIL